MTAMLGADIGNLQSLSTRFQTTGGTVAEGGSNQEMAISTAMANLREAAATMLARMQDADSTVKTSVSQVLQIGESSLSEVTAARGEAAGATWTGNNFAVFNSAADQFHTTMTTLTSNVRDQQTKDQQTVEALTASITEMKGQVEAFAGEVEAFGGQIKVATTDAQASCDSMATAVTQQAAALETTMNTGMSVG